MSAISQAQRHRGKAPRDAELFGAQQLNQLRTATSDLCWLLSRGYNDQTSLKIVGDRYALTARQRKAVARCSCAEKDRESRIDRKNEIASCAGRRLLVDGFNCLIGVETALSGGLVLLARDEAHRDLASVQGTYRLVRETPRAIELIGESIARLKASRVEWLFDKPVSNSGRLKARVMEVSEARGWNWTVELRSNVDRNLIEADAIVASADSWVLDRCQEGWVDVVGATIACAIPDAWVVTL